MVGLIASLIVTALLVALVFPMAKRRPVGRRLTWGEAMFAATYTYFLFFWIYGVVPHLWLTYADSELKWRNDKLLFGPSDILKPQKYDGWSPITLNYQVLRDIVVVVIYVGFLAGTIALWAYWQKRGIRAERSAAELEASDYGRPLLRKG